MDKRTAIIMWIIALVFTNQIIIAQQKIEKNNTIKVMTYNIHHGVNNNGEFDLDAIAKIIINENPDFVALQEVDSVIERSNNLDISKILGQKANMFSVFGKATTIDNGFYGVAILTKHPIIYTRNIALPFQVNEEPRTAIEITSSLPSGDTIHFVSTHLDYKDKNHHRKEQVQKINKVFSKNKHPTILAGDINDTPNSETLKLLKTIWIPTHHKDNPQSTFPSIKPYKKIDYILATPKNIWKTYGNLVIQDSIASDHRPYIALLKLIK